MTKRPAPPADQRASCFLSLPHGFDTVRDALKEAIKKAGGDSYFVIESRGTTLRDAITHDIHASSILIADLSSIPDKPIVKGPRPAIMWEAGYAEARGLHRIFICQRKDKALIPSILADYQIVFYDINKIENMTREVESAIRALMLKDARHRTTDFSARAYVDRSSAELDAKYLRADHTIKILELNLDTVASQVPTLISAIAKSPNLFVQILTLNPFSRFADDRANQLAELPLRYRRELFSKIKETHDGLGKADKARWGLRIYDTFPTQIMFQIDEALIHSIIALGRRSRLMLHFDVDRAQPNAADTFEAHFAELWSASVDYEAWLETNKQSVDRLFASDGPDPEVAVGGRRRRGDASQETPRN